MKVRPRRKNITNQDSGRIGKGNADFLRTVTVLLTALFQEFRTLPWVCYLLDDFEE